MIARAGRSPKKRKVAEETHQVTDPSLVRFDRRTWTVIGTLLLLLFLATSFRLHGASIAMWKTTNTCLLISLATPK